LQLLFGPEPFRKIVLEPGVPCTVGRGHRADAVLTRDKTLRGRHFEILWNGTVAEVRALDDPDSLEINGEKAPAGELKNRGWLRAGETSFCFYVEGLTPAREPRPAHPAVPKVIEALAPYRASGALYAVIDAARSERALELMEEAVDDHASLFEGAAGRGMDQVAPYLVHFAAGSELLDRLLAEGWGDAFGIYLASSVGPKLVRRHWRRFLIVTADPTGERLYFRYYDPRVLRAFLPIATPRQASELHADLEAIFYEDEAGALVRSSVAALDSSSLGDAAGATRAGEANDVSHP